MAYQPTSAEHLAASEAAIRDVCTELVPPATQSGGRPVHLRLGHFEHESMLSHLLYGFTILSVTRTNAPARAITGLDELDENFPYRWLSHWCTPEEVDQLLEPTTVEVSATMATDEDHPLVSAIVVNQGVDDQIHAALRAVATLIRRTQLVDDFRKHGRVHELTEAAGEADRIADATLRDAIRGEGWRAAAGQLMSQASLQEIRLCATYSAPLLSPDEVRRRVPLNRFVYNSLGPARELIDKTTTMMSQGMRVTGYSNAMTMRMADDLSDSAQLSRFLAHLTRDGFVCGNGVMHWGEDPSDVRLALPEEIQAIDVKKKAARVGSRGEGTNLTGILHASGAPQLGSSVSASVLEPFVQLASERTLFLRQYLSAGVLKNAPAAKWNPTLQEHADSIESVAISRLSGIDDAVKNTVGTATRNFRSAPSDLYFPGFERMEPAATNIILAGSEFD